MLLVGVGNPMRGDDGVGPAVAARVACLGLPNIEVVAESEPLDLVDLLRDRPGLAALVVVDATPPGAEPGRVRVLDVGTDRLTGPARAPGSSHGLGVAEALELARSLGVLPPKVTLVGVEAGSVGVGEELSAAVWQRVDDVVRLLSEVLAPAGAPPRAGP
jgi:hydrogenase maturation protease